MRKALFNFWDNVICKNGFSLGCLALICCIILLLLCLILEDALALFVAGFEFGCAVSCFIAHYFRPIEEAADHD